MGHISRKPPRARPILFAGSDMPDISGAGWSVAPPSAFCVTYELREKTGSLKLYPKPDPKLWLEDGPANGSIAELAR